MIGGIINLEKHFLQKTVCNKKQNFGILWGSQVSNFS